MGYFDYCCLIDGENCELHKSSGQDCSYSDVYLVDKELTKKIKALYTGYGYAEIKGEEIFDLGFEEEFGIEKDKKSSYLACQTCAKDINNEIKELDQFFTPDDNSSTIPTVDSSTIPTVDSSTIQNTKQIILKEYEKDLNNLISKREKLNKLIKKVRKNIADLNS